MRNAVAWLIVVSLLASLAAAEPAREVVEFPHIQIDRENKQLRIEAETIVVDMPLEFLLVARGGPDHETVLRTPARPSHIHAALLLLGLEPGQPVRYVEGADRWLPPSGPPLRAFVEMEVDGKVERVGVNRLMKSVRTGEEMPPLTFVFTGSRVIDGQYAGDATGYVISIVNFELTPIDVPQLVSSANETLEWAVNDKLVPPTGTKVTLILEPVGEDGAVKPPPATPAEALAGPTDPETLRARWRSRVRPHADALREAAETHFEVIRELRAEQQRLIDQADAIQRVIDELDREFANLSTPRPPRQPPTGE